MRNAFAQQQDTRMLEVIIDIADYLAVPVIAEGVETEEQMTTLKAMGCDLIQGYYFSRPIPAGEFEKFLLVRREQSAPALPLSKRARYGGENVSFGKVAHALSAGFESVYFVDVKNDHYVEFSARGGYAKRQIQHSGADFFSDAMADLSRALYPADLARVQSAMQKETLLDGLARQENVSLLYRLMIDGKAMWYFLKAIYAATGSRSHIVIGVASVDAAVRPLIG